MYKEIIYVALGWKPEKKGNGKNSTLIDLPGRRWWR